MNAYRFRTPHSLARIVLCLALLSLGACAVDRQHVALDGTSEKVTHTPATQATATSARNPLTSGLPPQEIELLASKAKIKYAPYWQVIDDRARYVRHRILKVLDELHAPRALQLVPVVESTYDPYAFSHSGAVGLWQLMPRTARGLGLVSNRAMNSRRNVRQSTHAAARYLLTLHDRFQSWPLAFAAYHMGPNALAKALQQHPWHASDGTQRMPVPDITRTYVQNIIGLSILFERGDFHFSKPIETVPLTVQPPVDLVQLQQALGKQDQLLFRLNPGLNNATYSREAITIQVPRSEQSQWLAMLPKAKPRFTQIRVKRGDTLWRIARAHHLSVAELKRINRLNGHATLHIGQQLTVPASTGTIAVARANPLLLRGNRVRYRVRRGDSLWKIARRFGTTPAAIARINNMGLHTPIRPGDTLWVHARQGES